MKRLDRYTIKSFLGPFVLTSTITMFILLMQFLWMYIDELVGKGLGMGIILEFLFWGSATLLPTALPLATLLASIMTMGGLGENNELLALKAAGVSVRRVMAPLVSASVIIACFAFYVSNNIIPIAYKNIYALRDDIGRTKEEIKIPSGIFYDGIEGYQLRNEYQDEEGYFHNVVVYDHTAGQGNVSVMMADRAEIRLTPDKKNLTFKLFDGQSYQETNSIGYRDTVLDQTIVSFDEQMLIIPLDDYAFSRSDEERFGNEVMAKDLKTLRHDQDSLSEEYYNYYPEQFRRFIYSSGMAYISQLDSSNHVAVDKIKGNLPYSVIDSLKEYVNQGFYSNAEQEIYRSVEGVDLHERDSYRYTDQIKRMSIEAYRKLALSLACLIFFFIGAPLGAIIRKGGLGTPVIISIMFFVVYYAVDLTGKKMARDGAITPFVGAFISSAVLLPVGIFLTIKSSQDSALFNLDSYKNAFEQIIGRLRKHRRKIISIMRKKGGKIDIVYMGTPEFAVAPLEALLETEFNIRAVVTVPDKQSGRGLQLRESAVKQFAVSKGIPVMQPVSLKDPAFLEQLKAFDADIFIVVAFRMLPKEVWSMPRLGTFNLHASLLPQYRGAAPINWAIINGEHLTGVTTFMIDEQIDTGAILFNEVCQIEDYDDAGSLHDKLTIMGAQMVVKTAEAIVMGSVKPKQQANYKNLHAAPKITKETCRIDWSKSAYEISLLVRGLSPYPAAFSLLAKKESEDDGANGVVVKIYEASEVSESSGKVPGTISTDGKSYLEIACGEGALRITSLQMAGKKRLEVTEFLKGFRDPDLYRLV